MSSLIIADQAETSRPAKSRAARLENPPKTRLTKESAKAIQFAGLSRLVRLAKLGADFRGWYPAAQAEAAFVCRAENWALSDFVARLAILSPRVSVRRNCRAALLWQDSRQAFNNTPKIVLGSLSAWEKSRTFSERARKVRRFHAAILGDTEALVLDTWIAKALKVDQAVLGSALGYQAAENQIRKAAKRLSWRPAETQAAIWAGIYRESTSGKRPQFLPLAEEYRLFLSLGRSFPLSGSIDKKAARLENPPRY